MNLLLSFLIMMEVLISTRTLRFMETIYRIGGAKTLKDSIMKTYKEQMFTLKKKLSTNSNDYYNSIYDCPIYAWEKAKENYNTEFLKPVNLYVNPKNVKKANTKEGDKTFLALLTEIFDEFGMNEELLKEIKIKEQLTKAYLEFAETGERTLLNAINLHKKELESKVLANNEKTVKFGEELATVSKNMGVIIDPKVTSVYNYYSAKTSLKHG